ncbi:hypothetical protein COCSUDRAFT_32277 [Coccomyxa subellipsoidea C-169]|uniref:Uncharacterized protein n=1 Tax=Coccomyxa subellipsoidea (strain C-169) TaxID=574566 RepID=I0Z827_COCSC|nr:hypothetical protein COCSUDRAFT_32277 [Coccomyxa subellipsoidea C-169]EIE26796.1 hypothetical protein COCSUDRAFT_32277 [Coccomyxa subellipsoidea C-169]|eukprot:XP_005651340.1 hypothetical protein COCSUDRAFT_32277 [Coccomyxa subellipsoidea C-169]
MVVDQYSSSHIWGIYPHSHTATKVSLKEVRSVHLMMLLQTACRLICQVQWSHRLVKNVLAVMRHKSPHSLGALILTAHL